MYMITNSSLLTKEQKREMGNWHCTIRNSDDKVSIDIWGHKLSKDDTEKIANIIVNSLNNQT